MSETLEPEAHLGRARQRREPLLFVIDQHCAVVYESHENHFDELLEFCTEPGVFRADVRAAALSLITTSTDVQALHCRSALIAPGHLLRLRRLRGSDRPLFVMIVEPFRNRDSVSVAVRRFSLTKREHEVMMLILEGASAPEMASALNISEHTIQGYFKRLLKKTGSRNRASMVANVLDWKRSAEMRQAGPHRYRADSGHPSDRAQGM